MALNPRSWRNSDGLNVWFGPSEGTSQKGGEVRTNGDARVIEQVITLTDLTSSAQYIDTHITIPTGALIEYVEVVTLTAATSGGSATLNIGLKGTDESTNVSDTALVSAAALTTIDAAGEKTTLVVGSTGAGSSIGATTSSKNHITAKYGTAAFTAGKVLVRVGLNFMT
jgi:hypothetical protein